MSDPRNDTGEQPQFSNEPTAQSQLLSPYLESALLEVQQAFSQGIASAYKYLQSIDFKGPNSPENGGISTDRLLQDPSRENNQFGRELPTEFDSLGLEKDGRGNREGIRGVATLPESNESPPDIDMRTSDSSDLGEIMPEKPVQTRRESTTNRTNRLGAENNTFESDCGFACQWATHSQVKGPPFSAVGHHLQLMGHPLLNI